MKKIECKCWCDFNEFERKFPLLEVAFTSLEALRGEAQAGIKNSVHQAFGGRKRRDWPESSTRLPLPSLGLGSRLCLSAKHSSWKGRGSERSVTQCLPSCSMFIDAELIVCLLTFSFKKTFVSPNCRVASSYQMPRTPCNPAFCLGSVRSAPDSQGSTTTELPIYLGEALLLYSLTPTVLKC